MACGEPRAKSIPNKHFKEKAVVCLLGGISPYVWCNLQPGRDQTLKTRFWASNLAGEITLEEWRLLNASSISRPSYFLKPSSTYQTSHRDTLENIRQHCAWSLLQYFKLKWVMWYRSQHTLAHPIASSTVGSEQEWGPASPWLPWHIITFPNFPLSQFPNCELPTGFSTWENMKIFKQCF